MIIYLFINISPSYMIFDDIFMIISFYLFFSRGNILRFYRLSIYVSDYVCWKNIFSFSGQQVRVNWNITFKIILGTILLLYIIMGMMFL